MKICLYFSIEYPKENDFVELLPCSICNRSFRSALLPRHSDICLKNAKRRKVPFDSSKQRIQGTEMAAYVQTMKKEQSSFVIAAKPETNWRIKHEDLIRVLKSARGEKVNDQSIAMKPTGTETCPHCMRNFGPKSYDRHVEFCKEKTRKISSAPNINLLAKERLEARKNVSIYIKLILIDCRSYKFDIFFFLKYFYSF